MAGTILTLIPIFIYGGIFKTFYQQDEWIALGHILTQGYSAFISSYSLLDLLGGQGRILAVPVHFSFFYFFPFNIFPFALFSLSLHIVNSILAYLVAKKLSKNYIIAFVTGIFFAVAPSADQGVTWVAGASTMTLPLTLFSLLSILFFLDFIQKKKKRFLWFSIVFSIVAYYFKESAIFLFILYPMLFMFLSGLKLKRALITMISIYWPILTFLLFLLIVRIASLFGGNHYGYFVTNSASNAKITILSHLILYPITSISQMFFHQGQMFTFASYFERVYYPYLALNVPNPMVFEYVVTDMLSVLITAIILIFSIVIYIFDKKSRKSLVFATLFTVLSFMPYIILNKANSYLEPRYYYLSVLGGGIILGVFVNSLKDLFNKRFKNYSYIFISIAIILLLLYFNSQIQWVQKGIKNQVDIAAERKNFLNTIKIDYPKLPQKVIFYITGNRDFNGPGYNVPLQLGPGYTLMVWYYNTGTIPSEFLKDDYLADMMVQGYREVNGRGFGFYRDIEMLKKDSKEKNLPIDNLIGFFYDAKNKKLIDISGEIQASLSARTIIK